MGLAIRGCTYTSSEVRILRIDGHIIRGDFVCISKIRSVGASFCIVFISWPQHLVIGYSTFEEGGYNYNPRAPCTYKENWDIKQSPGKVGAQIYVFSRRKRLMRCPVWCSQETASKPIIVPGQHPSTRDDAIPRHISTIHYCFLSPFKEKKNEKDRGTRATSAKLFCAKVLQTETGGKSNYTQHSFFLWLTHLQFKFH